MLCFAAPRLALPESYQELKFRKARNGECRFDTTRWEVLAYRPEAIAEVRVAVTHELAFASEARASFVVAHEEFHDQKSIRRLPAGLHEPAATLASFLVEPQPETGTGDPAFLFRQKAGLINDYGDQATQLYGRYDRGELTEFEALRLKQSIFDVLHADCADLAATPAFNPCPAALNNAGLAFDTTYTRLYPLIYELLLATGWDREETLRVLMFDLPETPEIESNPRQALQGRIARTRSATR
jgi:hypothetical protein